MKPLKLLISALKLTFYMGCIAITLTKCGATPTISIPIPDSSYLIISKDRVFVSKKSNSSDNSSISIKSMGSTIEGIANQAAGNKKDALDASDRAVKLEPNNDVHYSNRGMFFSESGDRQAAMADYNTAIKLNPNNSITYDNRGILKAQNGDAKGALSDYNLAIALDPMYAASYANRSQIYTSKGDTQKAIADLKKAAAIYKQEGRDDYYRAMIKEISRIHDSRKK